MLVARELEFPHETPSWAKYVGPLVHGTRHDVKVSPEDAARIQEIVAAAKQERKRVVHASFSTMDPADTTWLQALVAAVAGRDDLILVAGLGGRSASFPVAGGAGVHLFSWIPQLQVLEHADLSIHHGGIHTAHECLHHAVPMLLCSGGRYDQNGTVARLAHHGVATAMETAAQRPEALRGFIDQVLADEAQRARVRDVSARIHEARTTQLLERTIDVLLRS